MKCECSSLLSPFRSLRSAPCRMSPGRVLALPVEGASLPKENISLRGIRRMPSQGAGVVVEATFDMQPSIASVMERADTTTPATLRHGAERSERNGESRNNYTRDAFTFPTP